MDLLESYGEPSDLYLSRSEEVNIFRPIFTGDVFQRREGECDLGMIIVLAHPCSIRGREAQLLDDILVCSVEPLPSPPPSNKWASGFYRKMPLPDLGGCFRSADFQTIHQIRTDSVELGDRIACLSQFGINILQQRLVFHLTRFIAPTRDLDLAFGHTYAEAELLEEWVEMKHSVGMSDSDATRSFEDQIQKPFSEASIETMQDALRDPQKRAAVRKRLRSAANTG